MSHRTSKELDDARARYRGSIIPAEKVAVMDAQTEALRASDMTRNVLKPGVLAPDFILLSSTGREVRLHAALDHGQWLRP